MMDNDSIFSGVQARPANDVANTLHHWQPFAPDENFSMLVGAVTTLARTVDQLERQARAVDERLGPAVNPTGRTPAQHLELVTIGLREVYQMLGDGRTRAVNGNDMDVLFRAALARLSAMLDGLEGRSQ